MGLLIYLNLYAILSLETGGKTHIVNIAYWVVLISQLTISFLIVFKVEKFSMVHKILNVALIISIYIWVAISFQIGL
jgi:hypothetical protein